MTYYHRMLHEQQVNCPYCNVLFTAFLDLSQGDHHTIEDCYVCCRPIEYVIESNGSQLLRFDAFTDNESAY